MKIKMKQGMSGPTTNYDVGETYDFPAEEAVRLVAAGFAAAENPKEYQSLRSRTDLQTTVSEKGQNAENLLAVAKEKRAKCDEVLADTKAAEDVAATAAKELKDAEAALLKVPAPAPSPAS